MHTRLITELNDFLRTYYISVEKTDIFEETLLKLASVETQPKKCVFGEENDPDQMHFTIIGLEEKDTEKFLNFLKESGDANATSELVNIANDSEEPNIHHFHVDTAVVYNVLFPRFKAEISNINQNTPEKLEAYKKQSEEINSIKEYKLLEQIGKQFDEIQSSDLDEFSKGEFHVICENLNDAVAHHKMHRSLNCGSHDQLMVAFALFMKTCVENDKFRMNETIDKLMENIDAYCMLTTPVNPVLNLLRKVNVTTENLRSPEQRSKSIFGSLLNFFTPSNDYTSSSSDEDEEERLSDSPDSPDSPSMML